jgi:hypothetical protein
MQPLEICTMMTGDGTLMTQSREVIGLEIKTPSITCARKHQKPFMNYNLTVFHSLEPKKAKSISAPLEDNLHNMENVNRY